MLELWSILFDVIIWLAIAAAVILTIPYLFLRKALQPNLNMHPAPVDQFRRELSETGQYDHWAQKEGFEQLGGFVINLVAPSFVAAWQHQDKPTYFCIYVAQGDFGFDLVTLFEQDRGLTTCSRKDGHFFPQRPGAYLQSFSDITLDDLWIRHQEAEHYLIKNGHCKLHSKRCSFEEVFIKAIRKQLGYVRSIKLWPIRPLYWFLTRMSKWHNISIQLQHQRGMIILDSSAIQP